MKEQVEKPNHYVLDEENDLEVRHIINLFLNKIKKEHPEIDNLYEYANAIKYLLRSPFKENQEVDLKKSKYCIDLIINQMILKRNEH